MIHIIFSSLKKSYRALVPLWIRDLNRFCLKRVVYFYRFLQLYVVSRYSHQQLCIVLGSALTSFEGWYSTNEEYLDITKSKDWKRMFGQCERVSKMVAEHVLHFTIDEMIIALRLCYKYLDQSGTLLVAVPDGNHPDETYRIHTGINGIGADASDHKQFISFESFSCLLNRLVFR